MNFIKKLFDQPDSRISDPTHSSDLHAVEQKLSHMPQTEAKYLAGLALLLARVAHIDFKVSDGEKQRMREALKKHSHLTDEQAGIVLEIAVDRASRLSVEDHIVIRQVNATASAEQKKDLIRAMFYVASDAHVSEYESEEIFTIAKGLNFSRQQFLELRNEFRDHLALFKSLPK